MTDMVRSAKCQLRDVFGLTPRPGSHDSDPCFDNVPDGIYPMMFDGEDELVVIAGDKFFFDMKIIGPKNLK